MPGIHLGGRETGRGPGDGKAGEMSAYEEDSERLAEHNPETCDEPYCQICWDAEQIEDVDVEEK